MTITPADVRQDAFTENLDADWLAIDANGHVLRRAATIESAQHPDAAAYFTGVHFRDAGATAELVGSAVTLDEALEVLGDAVEDIKKFDHDGDGRAGGSRPKSAKAAPVAVPARKPKK